MKNKWFDMGTILEIIDGDESLVYCGWIYIVRGIRREIEEMIELVIELNHIGL